MVKLSSALLTLLLAAMLCHTCLCAAWPKKVPEVEDLMRQVGGTNADQPSESEELNSKGEAQTGVEEILDRAEKEVSC